MPLNQAAVVSRFIPSKSASVIDGRGGGGDDSAADRAEMIGVDFDSDRSLFGQIGV